MIIPPYRPDQGELISSTVNNVMMTRSGWAPDKLLTAIDGATAFPGTIRGHLSVVLPDGTFKVFGATSAEIYEMSATGTWGAGLSASLACPDGEDTIMKQFGVFLIATNTVDGMMAYNMETPAGVNAISGAPAARGVFPTDNLLVAYDCDGNNRRWQTSNRGSYTNWVTGTAIADDIEDGEALTGGWDLGHRRALLCQRQAINLMVFGPSGGEAHVSVHRLADGVGAVHPRSIKGYNGQVMMVHETGFLMASAEGVKNIGAEKVNRTFLEDCADLTKVYIEVDPRNTRFRVRYKAAADASDVTYSGFIDYNWVLDEFIPGTQNTQAIFRVAVPGYTLEGLDAVNASVDALTFSLDSAAYKGESPALGGLNGSALAGFFDGSNAAATLETNTQMGPNSVLINSVTPVTDDSAVTVQVGVKDKRSGSLTWGTAASTEDSGRAPVRARGKLYRFRANHAAAATWDLNHGFDGIEAVEGGPR